MAGVGQSKLDGLPEDWTYRDEGCKHAPSCLSCPFVRCLYDEPGGLLGMQRRERNAQATAMRATGVPVDAIASHLGISVRRVYSITR